MYLGIRGRAIPLSLVEHLWAAGMSDDGEWTVWECIPNPYADDGYELGAVVSHFVCEQSARDVVKCHNRAVQILGTIIMAGDNK